MLTTLEPLSAALAELSAQFSSATRLYDIRVGDGGVLSDALLVEAFYAEDALQQVPVRDVLVLSPSAHLDLAALAGQTAVLEVATAGGERACFGGEIRAIAQLGSDGGWARYRLRISPWIWRLEQAHNSRVWQEKTVMDIIDAVFAAYAPAARWRWSPEVDGWMAQAGPRSCCCQYRETDLAFVQRLLAEEGLGWRCEYTEDGETIVLFADSCDPGAIPDDPVSAADGAVRFHGHRAMERQDTVQHLRHSRSVGASLVTLLSYDYKAKSAVAGSSPSRLDAGGRLPPLESYDVPGAYAFADGGQARRYADIRMQALEARRQLWQGRSTVRTLRAGTRMAVSGMPLAMEQDSGAFTVLRVASIGINNLPAPARQAVAALFGPVADVLQECMAERAAPAWPGRGLTPAKVNGVAMWAGSDRTPLHPRASAAMWTAADRASMPAEAGSAALSPDFALMLAQARETGYANSFDAVAADVAWRPGCEAGDVPARPSAHGSQSAIVIGADGADTPAGADELYCDALGRVRIRFHWHDGEAATCWVRVAQRLAGQGMGSQFLPRIGQEVLVQFLEGDIDRPVIVGALYNGQGEGGIAPTPGGCSGGNASAGARNSAGANGGSAGGSSGNQGGNQGGNHGGSDGAPFASALDHRVAGQGNLAGGNSPVWHGAAAARDSHNNASALWGVRSKEFGGAGYNQLLFDDTDAQGRVQLRCTYAASELNLGHLIHGADNYRGSLRGLGAELRTDAYGAVRGGAGLLVTSYKAAYAASGRDPAGDNTAGIALLKQAAKVAESFSNAARNHETVALASHQGALRASASVLDTKQAPLAAMLTAVSGMVAGHAEAAALADATGRNTAPADGKIPHSTDPLIAIAAQAGLGVTAGQDMQLANGETVTVMSGADSQLAAGGAMRVHSRQAIGVLGGAVAPGEGGMGLQLVAAKGPVEIQAQSDTFAAQARDDVHIVSVNAHIDWAAAKTIRLSTAGGANITIDGGNITVQCPGKLSIQAGKKSFIGPGSQDYPLPELPRSELPLRELAFKLRLADTPGPQGHALGNTPWKIAFGPEPEGMAYIDDEQLLASGTTDDDGHIKLTPEQEKRLAEIYAAYPDHTWVVYPGHTVRLDVVEESPQWSEKEKLFHALNGADFSAGLHNSGRGATARAHARYATEAFKVAESNAVFSKYKA